MRKKYLWLPAAVFVFAALIAGGASATLSNGDVSFTVQPTLELTAEALGLGSVAPGVNNFGNRQLIKVRTNVPWRVTAYSASGFTNGSATIPAGNLKLNGTALPSTETIDIITGPTAATSQTISKSVELNVPWNVGQGIFTGTVTYTIYAQ